MKNRYRKIPAQIICLVITILALCAGNASAEEKNYLISPYSIEIALSMLKEGANGNTLKQLNEVFGICSVLNVIKPATGQHTKADKKQVKSKKKG